MQGSVKHTDNSCFLSILLESKLLGSQYHLAVAGGCEAQVNPHRLRTHPLPRGGTDRFQVRSDSTKDHETAAWAAIPQAQLH